MEHKTVLPTMALGLSGSVMVAAHTRQRPTSEDWEVYLKASRDWPLKCLLVYTPADFGGLDALQRQRSAEVWNERGMKPKVAVILHSTLARGVITVFSWLKTTNMQGFEPSRLEGALDFLGLQGAERNQVKSDLSELRSVLEERRSA